MKSQKSIANLKPVKSSWRHSETVAVRIPKDLKEDILEYARKIDRDESSQATVHLKDEIESLLAKIEAKEKGYKTNSASALIKDLKRIFQAE